MSATLVRILVTHSHRDWLQSTSEVRMGRVIGKEFLHAGCGLHDIAGVPRVTIDVV